MNIFQGYLFQNVWLWTNPATTVFRHYCSGTTMHARVTRILQWSVMAERSSALDSSFGAVRMWVRIPAWPVAALASLRTTLNHNCFVLWMGRKAVGPVCCVMYIKEPRTLIVKEKGACPSVSGFAP